MRWSSSPTPIAARPSTLRHIAAANASDERDQPALHQWRPRDLADALLAIRLLRGEIITSNSRKELLKLFSA
jgi:hypothetical protein